ncbi:MAG: hypothetical protein AAGB19_06975 [Cyanobacteria bacterium P01_F01_bin.3]
MISKPQPNMAENEHARMRSQIKLSLQKATSQRDRLMHTDRRFSIASLVLGAIATFIAGESAIAGEPMLGNWRFTTTIASLCTLGATVSTGVHKQVVPTDLLIETSECTAQLKVLAIETIPADYDVEVVTDSYQRLISEFSRVDV